MTHNNNPAVVARYPTRGGSRVHITRWGGRWWRYSWKCLGCENPPPPMRMLARRVAKRRGYRHAARCRAGAE